MALYSADDQVRSAMIRELCCWWRSRARGDIPDRSDFHPFEFRRLLPYLMIADVQRSPFRIRYRLVGTRVVDATGLDITGCYLDELAPGDDDEPWMDEYLLADQTREPVFGTSSIKTVSGVRFAYEFGLLPLRKGGTGIAQFVAIEDYFEFAHLFPDLPRWTTHAQTGRSAGDRKRALSLSHRSLPSS